MKKLSICIPTYNRSTHLNNCLNSIYLNGKILEHIEICISDNNSSDDTFKIINSFKNKINIKYNKNQNNIGVAKNILKTISMSNSEFCWVIGDDDLLFDNAVEEVLKKINEFKDTDFFYINSKHLDHSILDNYKKPINPNILNEKMNNFSDLDIDIRCNFIDLINPQVSFDYLGGLYLSVFRRSMWEKNLNRINTSNLNNKLLFSTFDNTFPHIIVFAYAFKNSKAFFYSKPLTINLYGVREWKSLYPLVRSIRLINALDLYFKNGLGIAKYIKYKNDTLKYFIPDIIRLVLTGKIGFSYFIEIIVFFFKNFYYPNIYLSLIYQLITTLKKYLK